MEEEGPFQRSDASHARGDGGKGGGAQEGMGVGSGVGYTEVGVGPTRVTHRRGGARRVTLATLHGTVCRPWGAGHTGGGKGVHGR